MGYLRLILLPAVIFAAACSGSDAEPSDKEIPITPKNPPSESPAPEDDPVVSQRVSDAKTIISIMERGYAPREWKKQSLGISFEERSDALVKSAGSVESEKDFFEAVAKYITGFRDSHTKHFLPSTAGAYLPFDADYIEGRVIVTAVSDSISEKISRGDELLEINGKPIAEELREISEYISSSNDKARMRIAAYTISNRPQSKLPFMPAEEKASFLIRKRSGETAFESFEWIRRGEEFAAVGQYPQDIKLSAASTSHSCDHGVISAIEAMAQRELPNERSPRLSNIQSSASFDPGRSFTERKAAPFMSGVFIEDGAKIGYLRIHTFSGRSINFSEAIAELEEEMTYFQDNTDALIVDVKENSGGDLCFLFRIASFFFDAPFPHTADRYRANRTILLNLEESAREGNAEKRKLAKAVAEKVRTALERGELLTEPITICDLSGAIQPYSDISGNPIFYSKPVMILADEFSASAADYFAALMQDLDRAKIFGTTTNGAGGAVMYWNGRLGYSEVMISHTFSLAIRKNPVISPIFGESPYIENTGVIPDIPYETTLDDFASGGSLYKRAAISSVLELIAQFHSDNLSDD